MLEDEVERRAQKQLTLRLRRSTANSTKTLETFDFAFNPTVNRQQVLQLASCDFIRQHRNVLICGPTGTGRPIWPRPWCMRLAGKASMRSLRPSPRCSNTSMAGGADGTLERRLQSYLRPDLLVLDDFGLKPLQAPGPGDLYDIIDGRYEQGSILLPMQPCPGRVA